MKSSVTQSISDAQRYNNARTRLNQKIDFAREMFLQGYNDERVLDALKEATRHAGIVATMAETLDI